MLLCVQANACPVLCARFGLASSCICKLSHACVQIEQAEYDAFFKTTFREFLEPLAQNHFNVEGTIEFSALLFVPGMAPFEQQVRTCMPGCLRASPATVSRR